MRYTSFFIVIVIVMST